MSTGHHSWKRRIAAGVLSSLSILLGAGTARAADQVLSVLYNFSGGTDGQAPQYALQLGSDGNLYGVSVGGIDGSSGTLQAPGSGTAFRVTPGGAVTTLFTFLSDYSVPLGASAIGNPDTSLVLQSDGSFYGGTLNGGFPYQYSCQFGCGTIFQLSRAGSLASIALPAFNSHFSPNYSYVTGLARTDDGLIYGAAAWKAVKDYNDLDINCGFVFSVDPANFLSGLQKIDFPVDPTGTVPLGACNPVGAPVQTSDHNLYGSYTYGKGGIYRFIPGVGSSILYAFSGGTDGASPNGRLTLGTDGSLYGTTTAGGNGFGTVFKLALDGTLTTLHTFTASAPSGGLVLGQDGNFYGTVSGSIYRISPGGDFTTLYSGSNLPNEWTLGPGSDLYGLSSTGGTFGFGSVVKFGSSMANSPQVTATVSPTPVMAGDTYTVTWSSTNAASCSAADAWSGTIANSGSQSFSANKDVYTIGVFETKTYRVYCVGQDGVTTASAAATVNISPAPVPVISISASSTTLALGQSSTITWTTTNATSCVASGGKDSVNWSGSLPISGSRMVTPQKSGNFQYSITCYNGPAPYSSYATSSVEIDIPPITIGVDPASIELGQSATLSWTTAADMISCQGSGSWSGAKPLSGTHTLTPVRMNVYQYFLNCSRSDGSVEQAYTTLSVVPTITFTANPSSISQGQASTLQWTSNATACSGSGAWSVSKLPANGSRQVRPKTVGNNVYQLTCTFLRPLPGGGTEGVASSATTTVTVTN